MAPATHLPRRAAHYRVANPSQDTTNGSKLAPQPDECNDSNSGPLNEMPPDGYLLEKEPGAGGVPPDGAYLERLANKDQVSTTADGNTLHKVAS